MKIKKENQHLTFKPKLKKNIFPQIFDHKNLREDENLKPIKLISVKNKRGSSNSELKILFELPISNSTADVFLFLNDLKTDMYCSIPPGIYGFPIHLGDGKNTIELYYLRNGFKSPSVNKVVVCK